MVMGNPAGDSPIGRAQLLGLTSSPVLEHDRPDMCGLILSSGMCTVYTIPRAGDGITRWYVAWSSEILGTEAGRDTPGRVAQQQLTAGLESIPLL